MRCHEVCFLPAEERIAALEHRNENREAVIKVIRPRDVPVRVFLPGSESGIDLLETVLRDKPATGPAPEKLRQLDLYTVKLDEKMNRLELDIDELRKSCDDLIQEQERSENNNTLDAGMLDHIVEKSQRRVSFEPSLTVRPSSAGTRNPCEYSSPRGGAASDQFGASQIHSSISNLHTENRKLYWKNWELQRENDDMHHEIEMIRLKLERYKRPARHSTYSSRVDPNDSCQSNSDHHRHRDYGNSSQQHSNYSSQRPLYNSPRARDSGYSSLRDSNYSSLRDSNYSSVRDSARLHDPCYSTPRARDSGYSSLSESKYSSLRQS